MGVGRLHDRKMIGNVPCIGVRRVLGRMEGGSESLIICGDDDEQYIMKLNRNSQGPNILANEYMGSFILTGLGVRTPKTALIAANTKDILRASYGFANWQISRSDANSIHFGSRYLGSARAEITQSITRTQLATLKNPLDLLNVALFDLWANHTDARQFIFRRSEDGYRYSAYPIDNGHLFGGPHWRMECTETSRRIWINQAGGEIDAFMVKRIRWLQLYIPRLLSEALSRVPEEWFAGSTVVLEDALLDRLSRLEEFAAGAIMSSCSDHHHV